MRSSTRIPIYASSRPNENPPAPNTRLPSEKLVPFVFYGPTCDNMDKMKGPFLLPEDTQEGDWIESGGIDAIDVYTTDAEIGYYRLRPPVKPITLGELASLPIAEAERKAVER